MLIGDFIGVCDCYQDFSVAREAYSLVKASSSEETFLLRLTLLDVADYELWIRMGAIELSFIDLEYVRNYLMEDNVDWSLLGYEVCDSNLESGLVNASDCRDTEILTEVFGPSVNKYGLFNDENAARRFAHIVGQAAEEENSCPMIVFKYERILEPELPPVNPANG